MPADPVGLRPALPLPEAAPFREELAPLGAARVLVAELPEAALLPRPEEAEAGFPDLAPLLAALLALVLFGDALAGFERPEAADLAPRPVEPAPREPAEAAASPLDPPFARPLALGRVVPRRPEEPEEPVEALELPDSADVESPPPPPMPPIALIAPSAIIRRTASVAALIIAAPTLLAVSAATSAAVSAAS
ncbi:MAG TPA: hypothetical protein VF689_01910 [Allosphingosinicella sp.]